MADLIKENVGVEMHPSMPVEEARKIADGIGVEWLDAWGSGKIISEVYDESSEHLLIEPTFVIDHPREISPLARAHRDDPELTERFELVVAARELANAYSELNDPVDQAERFESEARLQAGGDDEAEPVDDDYVKALEYRLPPTGGLGIGLDRLVMLISGDEAIRDVILFPTLRPEGREAGEGADDAPPIIADAGVAERDRRVAVAATHGNEHSTLAGALQLHSRWGSLGGVDRIGRSRPGIDCRRPRTQPRQAQGLGDRDRTVRRRRGRAPDPRPGPDHGGVLGGDAGSAGRHLRSRLPNRRFLFTWITLFAERAHVSPDLSFWGIVETAYKGMVGLDGPYTYGRQVFADFFEISLIVLGVAGLLILLYLVLRTFVQTEPPSVDRRRHAEELVRQWGDDTLDYFALRRDKNYFFSADGKSLIAYLYVRGTAVVAADPIGPPGDEARTLDEFLAFCAERGWRVAFFAVREADAELYRARGMHTIYLGDEAILHCDEFSLDGAGMKAVRAAVKHVEKDHSFELIAETEASPELIAELNEISEEWREGAPERGFTMELGEDVGQAERLRAGDRPRQAGRPGRGLPPLRPGLRRRTRLLACRGWRCSTPASRASSRCQC